MHESHQCHEHCEIPFRGQARPCLFLPNIRSRWVVLVACYDGGNLLLYRVVPHDEDVRVLGADEKGKEVVTVNRFLGVESVVSSSENHYIFLHNQSTSWYMLTLLSESIREHIWL